MQKQTPQLNITPPVKPASTIKYQLLQLLMLLIVVPVLSQLLLVAAYFLVERRDGISDSQFALLAGLATMGVVIIYMVSYWWGRKIKAVPESFGNRYALMLIVIIYAVLLYTIILYAGNMSEYGQGYLFLFGYSIFIFIISALSVMWNHFLSNLNPLPHAYFFMIFCIGFISCILLYFVGFALGLRHQGIARSTNRGWSIYIMILLALLSVCGWKFYQEQKNLISIEMHNIEPAVYRKETHAYWPYNHTGTVTPLRGDSTLFITEKFPLLNSATAFFPIVASAVYKVYNHPNHPAMDDHQLRQVLRSSRTPDAYERLIEGHVDLIFVLQPSDEQQAAAKAKELELTLTPIGKEAFVFFVNTQNPVKSLTLEQVRDIYSGKINNWQEVGGKNNKIMAFQRSEGSGSQTAMEKQVMQGLQMREPLEEEFSDEMGSMYRGVAHYRNAQSAIGYSFRFYSTGMQKGGDIRLLAINGIEPTAENIRNGSYPFIADFYIVSARPLSENAQKFKNWFLSDQGQALIQDVGYIPVREQSALTSEKRTP